MSEFQEKLQIMKEGITEEINNVENNPALISSDLVNDNEDEVSNYQSDKLEEPKIRTSSNQRNDKGHRKRRVNDRLEAVLAENRAKDAQNQQLMEFIQDQERRLAEAQAKAEQNAHYSNVYYEKSLENEEQKILTELEIAKESGDIKQEVALHKILSEIAAQKQTQLLSKTLPRQQPHPETYREPNYYQPQYQPQVIQEEPTNEHFEDWLEDNPWADPRSPEYDEGLSQEVNELALEFNKNLKFKRAGNMIGTPEYYSSLSSIMNERYGGNSNNNDNYNNNDYIDNRAYEVAPVTKRGSSMADRYVSHNQSPNRSVRPNNITLTKDQYEVASKLAPILSTVYKRPVSTEEAVAEYYKQNMDLKKFPHNY